jgi:hypothetical protein
MSMKPAAPDALPEEAPLSISPLTVDSLALDPVQQ